MKKEQSFFRKVKISSERGKAKQCTICGKKFGTEHQCKRCKRAVCDKCSPFKGLSFDEKGVIEKALHRQCKVCKEESDSIKKFIDSNHIYFLQDTKSIDWLNQFGVTKEQAKAEYFQAQSKISQNESTEVRKLTNNLSLAFSEFPGCFNFSIREFLHYVIKETEYEQLKQVSGRVLETFLSLYPEVGYSSDLIVLTIFFLCFSSEATAFSLLNIFFAEMISADLYPSNLTSYDNDQDIERVLQVLQSSFKLQKQDYPFIKNFLKQKLLRYQQCFTINMLQFESTFFIIDSLYTLHQQAQDEFIKFIASALAQNISDVKGLQTNYDEIEVILLRQVKLQMIQDGYFKTKTVVFSPYVKSMSRSQITSRFSSVIQDTTSSNMEFDRVQILNQIVENQKEEIAKLSTQLQQGQEIVRKKTISVKPKDTSNILNDLKQVDDEDLVFQNLRKKTLHLIQAQELDEDVVILTDYINKLEEVLTLKHRLLKDQNLKILELTDKNDKLFDEYQKLKRELQLSEVKITEQAKLTMQAEREAQDRQKIADDYKKRNKELQDNLINSQNELNTYKIQMLEVQAIGGTNTAVDNFKQSQQTKELQRLQEENSKYLRKIGELEVTILEMNTKQSEQNETRKLQIQINQVEQQKYLLNAQLSQREVTITQLQKQIENLLVEASMKPEGDQVVQEKKKNAELMMKINNYESQEKVLKSKYNEIERKLQEQMLLNQEFQTRQKSSGSAISKGEVERNYDTLREQLKSELEAKNALTKSLIHQIEELTLNLNQEKSKYQNLAIDYDQLLEQTNVRQNRSQTIQQQNQQKDQRIQDFSSQIEQLMLENQKIKSQHQQLAVMHQSLQDNFKKTELQVVELEHSKKMYERSVQEKVEQITQLETKVRELLSIKNSLDEQLNESLKKQSEYKIQLDGLQFQVGNKGREYESFQMKIDEQEVIILGYKERFNKVKESNEAGINEKTLLESEFENLKKQLKMKEDQVQQRVDQINGLNNQLKDLNDKISFLEQSKILQQKQIKNTEDNQNMKEREYQNEISRITTERDILRQRYQESEVQILKLQQIEKKLKNELSNQNEEIQQLLLNQDQLNNQVKDYELQSNTIRENSLETNKNQQIRLEKLEQQNQNLNIKVESQAQEIKSYISKIEEQLTILTELKYKVQEEESLRKAKEKQANDKIQQISKLEAQLIKVNEKYNQSKQQMQEVSGQYDDLRKKYDNEQGNLQSLQTKSLEYNQLQQKFIEQSSKLNQLEQKLLDFNEIQDQYSKQKKELASLSDLLDSKLQTIVNQETKVIDLTNQLKESNKELQMARKENHELMQKRAQDMQAMAQLKQIEVENGELKQLVYQHESTIQNQESLLSVLKGNQLSFEQSQMKLKIDYQHLEEKHNEKLVEYDEKSKQFINLQNKYDQLSFRSAQFEENLRILEEQRDDYQSKFELAQQELDIYKGKDKEISQMAANKIELQEQMHQIQKRNKLLERELQAAQSSTQAKETDIFQLQHVIEKKEQQITNLETQIVKLKSELSNQKNAYESLSLELAELNSEQASSGELFSQVKKLTAENLSKKSQMDQLKIQINELQEKNKGLEKQYNKLRSESLMGQSYQPDSDSQQKVVDLEAQVKQLNQNNRTKDAQISELKYAVEQSQNGQNQQKVIIEVEKPKKQNEIRNDNDKSEQYQFIIDQQREEIENLKKNSQGLGEELFELLNQILSVFLKKKVKKDQINIQSVLEQIKIFQKENKTLTIREEDNDQTVLQKLQQYRGDYINFRFRVEQILNKIVTLKQQMLQVIGDAKVQGKKKDIDKNMEAENLIMYLKLLLDSQAVQLNNQIALCQQYEAELQSYNNNTSPQGQIIQQVKELLSKAPFLTQQQIYQFTEPKVQIKLRKDQDQEDARLLLEARNQQITWLKSLINEKQDQLAVMNTYLANLKQLMDKYHLK